MSTLTSRCASATAHVAPESNHYDLDKYEELKNSYTFVSSALYGLGHSPHAFHQHLDKWFCDNNWQPLEADLCTCIKLDAEGQHIVAMAATFVDACICVGTDTALNDYHQFMAAGYTISDLSEPTDFLSMQIHYNHENKSLKIYQEKYIQKIAEHFDILLTANLPKTPLLHDK